MNIHVPLRSILVATNLSDIKWLFPLACSVAEESGASITLLYVITMMQGMTIDQGGLPYYGPTSALAEAEKELQTYCARARAANIQCEAIVVEGRPAEEILATTKKLHTELLIMGTRSHSGIEKWLLGSVAESVLRSSSVPVITVGPNARKAAASRRPIQSILLATSLKSKLNNAVKIASQWSERLHARLALLHVVPASSRDKALPEKIAQARESELRALLPDPASHSDLVETHVRTGQVVHEILAASARFDLLALGAVRNSALERLAPGGTLYRVLAEAHCPVATFHSEHGK